MGKLTKTYEGLVDEFSNLFVIDEDGNSSCVPCIWANKKRAFELATWDTPFISFYTTNIERETKESDFACVTNTSHTYLHFDLCTWSFSRETSNQMVEQILLIESNQINGEYKEIDVEEKTLYSWQFVVKLEL